jgi:hypothetical protein
MEITRRKAVELLKKSEGKMFGVTFVKKNGEIRNLNGRLGVHKYVTGVGLAFDHNDYGLITVFDIQKDAYRMVNIKTILQVRTGGEIYTVAE